MEVLPAIDLVGGNCVRLIQGQYHRQINYESDPIAQAQKFAQAGAKWLHIVDLDGARLGEPVNLDAIKAIVQNKAIANIEVGGGIRNEQSIRQLLDIGVDRVIVGTQAVSNFEWFTEMCEKFTQKLVLSLDARGSKVAIKGWTLDSPQRLWDFANQTANLPIAAIIYTDIDKDGMMSGPNFERTRALVDAVDKPIIAAGGVTDLSDIENLKNTGAAGAIIGRALYEQKIDLAQAIKAARRAPIDQ